MSSIVTRPPEIEEIPILQDIWKSGFGEDPDMSLFFDHYFSPKLCVVACLDTAPVGAGYLIPIGDLVYAARRFPCSYIYAVAVMAECRGLGLGTAVVQGLIESGRASGYPLIALCPAEDTLFEYYSERTGLSEWFYTREIKTTAPDHYNTSVYLSEISVAEYSDIRERLLSRTPHIEHNLRAIEYQRLLCQSHGGGLYSVKIGGDIFCATVDIQENRQVLIKELLAPVGMYNAVFFALTTLFPATSYLIRTPVKNIDNKDNRRFGMLAIPHGFSFDNDTNSLPPVPSQLNHCSECLDPTPWFGLAFD